MLPVFPTTFLWTATPHDVPLSLQWCNLKAECHRPVVVRLSVPLRTGSAQGYV